MPNNLVALFSVFNEAKFIGDSVKRIAPWVGRIHVFDGAYKQFPHSDPYSTDGTLEIVESTCPSAYVHHCEKAWDSQIAKRSKTLEVMKPGEFGLFLDADMLLANPEVLEDLDYDSIDVGWGIVRSPLYAHEYRIPILFRNIPGMHYAGRHYWMFDGDNNLIASHQHKTNRYRHVDIPLIMYNQLQETSKERQLAKIEFRRNRNRDELRFKSEDDVYGKGEIYVAHPQRATTPKAKIQVIKESSHKPVYSMCLAVSRPWAVDRWCDWFKNVKVPWEETELIVCLDNDDRRVLNNLKKKLLQDVAPDAHSIKIWFSGDPKLAEIGRVALRRERICRNWIVFLTESRGAIMLGAEDDTLPDYNAYIDLIEIYNRSGASFVQGTELGRWGCQVYPHWQIKEQNNEIVCIASATPKAQENIIPIMGGGWYCFIGNMQEIRKCTLGWSADPPMGPDVQLVYEMHKRGCKCLGVWSVNCIHFGQDFELHPSVSSVDVLTRKKKNGAWTMDVKRIKDGSGKDSYCNQARKYTKTVHQNDKGKNVMDPVSKQKHDVYAEALATLHSGSHVYGMVFRGARFWTTRYMASKLGKKIKILDPEEAPVGDHASEHAVTGPEGPIEATQPFQTKEMPNG